MPATLYIEGLTLSQNPWDVTLQFSNSNIQMDVEATVFDVTFGSSGIKMKNVTTTLPWIASKSAAMQWESGKAKDLGVYLTPVSQLALGGLEWTIDSRTAVTSSILTYAEFVHSWMIS